MTRVSRSTARALALTLLGALLFGGAAALLALRDYPTYEARAQVRLLNDPQIGDELVTGGGTDQAASFVSTELVTINSSDLRAVAEREVGHAFSASALQVGTSSVVELTTRSTERSVVGDSQSLLDAYVAQRRAALIVRITSVGAEVDSQLKAASNAIIALQQQDTVTSQIQQAALTQEFTRLNEQRNTLGVAQGAAGRLVQVVTTAASGGARQVISPARDGALGAVAGAVLGLGTALALGRLRSRVRGLEDLLDTAPEVALPTMPRLSGRSLTLQAGGATSAYVSALTPPGSDFARPPLVVLAPTTGCGATLMAVGLAVASARRGPTLLLSAGDALDGAAARLLGVDLEAPPPATSGRKTTYDDLLYVAAVDGSGPDAIAQLEHRVASGVLADAVRSGAAVVVDAPALSTSSAGLELARQAGQVLLVGGVEHTTPGELEAASRAVQRVGATLTGVVLNTPGGRGLLPWRRRR